MKKCMIRALGIIFCLAFIVSLMAGCAGTPTTTSGTTSSGTAAGTTAGTTTAGTTTAGTTAATTAATTATPTTTSEPIRVTAIKVEGANYDTRPTMWIFVKIAQATGVMIDVQRIDATAWNDTKTLLFASNDLPEFINGPLTDADWLSFYGVGQLLAVDDLLQVMPNYQKFLSEKFTPGELLGLFDNDGNQKGFTTSSFGVSFMAIPGPRMVINKTWMENLGLQMPTTFDEFVNVLREFKTKDPNGNGQADEIPLGGYKAGYGVDAFIAMPLGASVGWTTKSDWIKADNQIEYLYTNQRYRVFLEHMRQLYSEGLLDNEYYTQNDAQYLAKGANMQIGACTTAASFALTGSQDESIYMQYTGMIPMGSEFAEAKTTYSGFYGVGVYLTSKAKELNHMETIAKLVDYFYSEDYATFYYGPEKGNEVLGDWDGQGGVIWNADKTHWDLEVPSKYTGAYEYISQAVTGDWFQGGAFISDYLQKWNMGKDDANLIKQYEAVWDYVTPTFPPAAMAFTSEERDQIALVGSELSTYVSQMEAKFVMGEQELNDTSWAAFQQKLKSMDVDTLAIIYKNAYTRFLDRLSKMK